MRDIVKDENKIIEDIESRDIIEDVEDDGPVELITTGIDLWDCQCGGGFPLGKIVNIIGSEHTGKSLLASELINAAHKKYKDKFKWVYDDAEEGYSFNSKKIWGIEIIDEEFENSYTIEDFEANLRKALGKLKDDEFMYYILDSFDSLTTDAEIEYHKKKMTAHEKGKTPDAGTYGTSKAKGLSQFFRMIRREIKDKKCCVVVLSQVRENIGVMFGKQYTRTGGKALDHNAFLKFWLAIAERNEIKGIGLPPTVRILCDKNKITGKQDRKIWLDQYEFGVDNVKSNLAFLYGLKTPEGKSKKKSDEKSLLWNDVEYSFNDLVIYIEENNFENELRRKVRYKWQEIEDSVDTSKGRKPKYEL